MTNPTATIERPLTYEDLEAFPDDGMRREVIGGMLYVSPAPARPHQKVLGRFFRLFSDEIELTGLGEVFFSPVDVRFSPIDQVQPDLIVLLNHRLDTYRGSTVFGPPDIVVEVISPSSKSYDRATKFNLFESQGVPEYWVADPVALTLQQFALQNGRYVEVPPDSEGRFRSTVVPSLVIDPAFLFAGLTGTEEQ